ncbi:MAG TPA: FHA domain-containing protein [Thermoleophilaceae bacterium]|nr:FHA domain-containing protein [Thermoleophilaceae bacterium]
MELIVVEGPDQGRSFALSAESVIGRDPTAAIHLTDKEVSRRHAIVTVGEGRATVEDLGSFNGTHIDGTEITAETPLKVGDRISLGQSVLELREISGSEDPEALKPTKTSLPRP